MVELRSTPEGNVKEGVYMYGSDPSYATETISPELAERYLGENKQNRSLKTRYVRKLTGAITRGEWVLNGESIKFDVDGNLIDGQHRLAAVIEANQTIESLVVRNASREAQETVDVGLKRSLADALKIRGELSHSHTAAAIGWFYRMQKGMSARVTGPGAKGTGGPDYPSVQQGIAILESNPGLRESRAMGSRLNAHLGIPTGLATALYYTFSSIDNQDSEVFFEYLVGGANLGEKDPIHILRETLLRYNGQRPKPQQLMYAAVIIKGWNFYRKGQDVSRITWSPGGSRREPFPTPE